jgi:hypothetical protein
LGPTSPLKPKTGLEWGTRPTYLTRELRCQYDSAMRKILAGLRKDLWFVILVVVGLMSGITAIFREGLATFYPTAFNSSRVFQLCLWTCFFVSMTALVFRQRATIVNLESRLDQSDAQKAENKRLNSLFADLSKEGEALADELRRGMLHFGPWLQKREKWKQRTSKNIEDAGWPVDAADFRHSGEKDLKVGPGTVMNDGILFELYRDQLSGCRKKLAEIVARRLS